MEDAVQKKIALSCVACGDSEYSFFGRKNGFDLYECDNCRLLILHPIPQSIADIYNTTYFTGADHGHGYIDYDRDKSAMKKVFEKYLNLFSNILGRKGNLLDIGAATGYFMNIARENGWASRGVEVSKFAVEKGKEKNLDITWGTVNNTQFEHNSFDVITMLDVIEHVQNPMTDILILKKYLKDDGLLVINTPDRSSLFARILGLRWQLIIPPEHTYLFGRKNMEMLLNRTGFEVVEYKRIGKVFSLAYVIHMLMISGWLGSLPKKILPHIKNHPKIANISLPINLRDNMFVVARKVQK